MELAPQGGGEKEEKRHLPMQQYGDGFLKLFVCPWSMVTFVFLAAVAMKYFVGLPAAKGGLSGAGIISNV